ncbi:hypothetical protein [Paenibacillus sp. FSL M7-0420]|uniref:hypothetical protein n=1 Tax=Paenibacillus sp. FSL M7-0420 TaxID=2921609 RepID=UPI0030FA5B71
MDKKEKHKEENDMAAATKPIDEMRITLDEADYYKFIEFATKKTPSFAKMGDRFKNHKRAKPRK